MPLSAIHPTRSCRLFDLVDVVALLEHAGVPCLVFGGWAEELLALRPPGPHGDIDLVHLDESFATTDDALKSGRLPDEIRAKRFPHKRAFLWRGLCCEILLIQDWGARPVTRFWGDVPLFWQAPIPHAGPVIRAGHRFDVVSPANLRLYRARHRDTQPWRWRTFSGEGGQVGTRLRLAWPPLTRPRHYSRGGPTISMLCSVSSARSVSSSASFHRTK